MECKQNSFSETNYSFPANWKVIVRIKNKVNFNIQIMLNKCSVFSELPSNDKVKSKNVQSHCTLYYINNKIYFKSFCGIET
jgi:hypothetical protein